MSKLSVDLLFENESILVVDKPSGYLSVPSRMGRADKRPVLGLILQEYLRKNIFPVHRLDEETSGLILFAKTSDVQKILSRCFEARKVHKHYEAMTEFHSDFETWVGRHLKNRLFRGKKRAFEAKHGQDAETIVTKVERVSDRTSHDEHPRLLWHLRPLTGRSHQLRVQLALRGFPILGDELYGGANSESFPVDLFLPSESRKDHMIALRAVHLDFSESAADLAPMGIPTHFEAPRWSSSRG